MKTSTVKKLFVCSLFTVHCSLFTHSQTISTFAGIGVKGYSGDAGAASAAELYYPQGLAFDKSGNLYIADGLNYVIRQVNASGIISTYAGNGGQGYSGDGGPAIHARLGQPVNIAFSPSGNLYFTDNPNAVVRMVNTSANISTVAGNHAKGAGYSGDGGLDTAAQLWSPVGIAFDPSGNFYIADSYNNLIRKVNTSNTINSFAGNYNYGNGYSGDGGQATAAEINSPNGVVFSASGNLCFSDYSNTVVRKVDGSGKITTIAGEFPYSGYSGDGGPATSAEVNYPQGLAYDAAGNLYIADGANFVIRKVNTSGTISTVVGNHVSGYSGDSGPATTTELSGPYAMAFDVSGNLYISDQLANVVRKVTGLSTGIDELIMNNEELSVFPNPSNGKFTLEMKNEKLKVKNIEVYNVMGEKVFSQLSTLNSQLSIDLSSQSNGIYFLKVQMQDGSMEVKRVEVMR